MAEYQKFIFSENYSKAPENLEKLRVKKLEESRELLQAEHEQAKKNAFEEGFQEGQRMALEKLKSEMDLHINTIIQSVTQINEFKPELQNLYEQHSTACVRHLAKEMFFKSQEFFPEKILEQTILNALENTPMMVKIIIKVPANCLAYLQDTKIEERIKLAGITDFAFVEDINLNPGECKIEWDKSGVLSTKVDSFEKINAAFNAFLSPEDIELSDNTISTGEVEVTEPESVETTEQSELSDQQEAPTEATEFIEQPETEQQITTA